MLENIYDRPYNNEKEIGTACSMTFYQVEDKNRVLVLNYYVGNNIRDMKQRYTEMNKCDVVEFYKTCELDIWNSANERRNLEIKRGIKRTPLKPMVFSDFDINSIKQILEI